MHKQDYRVVELFQGSYQRELVNSWRLIKSLARIRRTIDQASQLEDLLNWETEFQVHLKLYEKS